MTQADATDRLLAEIGKESPEVRLEIEQAVGEVTIAILSQNGGQHHRLEVTQDITLLDTGDSVRLNGNLNTAKDTFIQVESDGDFLREIDIVTEEEHYHRKGNAQYTGQYWVYIVTNTGGASGAGEYLMFPFERTGTTYFKFFYYRRPTEQDTDAIVNIAAVLEGVRGRKRDLWPEATEALQVYLSERRSEVSNPRRRGATMSLKPNKRQRRQNRMNNRIGRGG
jgi:hypothetical protein